MLAAGSAGILSAVFLQTKSAAIGSGSAADDGLSVRASQIVISITVKNSNCSLSIGFTAHSLHLFIVED